MTEKKRRRKGSGRPGWLRQTLAFGKARKRQRTERPAREAGRDPRQEGGER